MGYIVTLSLHLNPKTQATKQTLPPSLRNVLLFTIRSAASHQQLHGIHLVDFDV